MSFKYSNTELHKFVKQYVISKSGELVEISEEIFQVKYPHSVAQKEFTYQPLIARERNISLMGTGTPAFQQILKESLEKGILCSAEIIQCDTIESLLKNYFKDSSYGCPDCDVTKVGKSSCYICIKSPPCCHRVNNGSVESTKVASQHNIELFQFYFSVTFQSRLRPKSEELIVLLFDENGQYYDKNILDSTHTELKESNLAIDLKIFDKMKSVSDQKLDTVIKNKLSVFDAALVNDLRKKLRTFDKRLKNERREIIFSKRAEDFSESEWKKNHDKLLQNEEQSLKTQVSIKFLNLLIAQTEKIDLEIQLSNGCKIPSTFIRGITQPQIQCPNCGNTIFEGYCTEDKAYLCLDCVHQSIETGKLFANTQSLIPDPYLGEYLEKNEGFRCSVCGQQGSKLLQYNCSYDNSAVCVQHYDTCDSCKRIFSLRNLLTTQRSKKKLCFEHSTKCDICQSNIGLDEYRICKGSGKRICTCTSFTKCPTCEQEYSQTTLIAGKCPACNSLIDSSPLSYVRRGN